jgi:acyl dehydratase
MGLDAVIAHGMLTIGIGGSYITSWVADGVAVTLWDGISSRHRARLTLSVGSVHNI